jgi:hypothetical protein
LAHIGDAGGDEWRVEAARISRLAGFTPLRFWVYNGASVTASDVNIRVELPALDGLEIMEETDHPRYGSMGIRTPFGTAAVDRVGDRWRIEVKLRKLQPQEEQFTGEFLVRAEHAMELDGIARISADNLAEPVTLPVQIALSTDDVEVSYDQAEELWDKMLD